MKLSEQFKVDRPMLSFEVFPPKTEARFEPIMSAVEEIAKLDPAYMSVTYGAGGGTSRYTIDIAKNIEDKYQVPLLVHLTCISSSKEAVRAQIAAMRAAGIRNVMALRGDIPDQMQGSDRSGWDYHYASELIRELKESGDDFCIGGACYPEVHPESPSQREDIRRLKEKVEAGADFLTTQMVFDNNLFFNFLYKLREAGVTVPVVPGIMPITNGNQVERAIRLSGSFMPQRFRSIVDRFGHDPEAMRQAGIAYAVDQIIDLYANGITNIHVYSMNKPEVAAGILDRLSGILGKDFSGM